MKKKNATEIATFLLSKALGTGEKTSNSFPPTYSFTESSVCVDLYDLREFAGRNCKETFLMKVCREMSSKKVGRRCTFADLGIMDERRGGPIIEFRIHTSLHAIKCSEEEEGEDGEVETLPGRPLLDRMVDGEEEDEDLRPKKQSPSQDVSTSTDARLRAAAYEKETAALHMFISQLFWFVNEVVRERDFPKKPVANLMQVDEFSLEIPICLKDLSTELGVECTERFLVRVFDFLNEESDSDYAWTYVAGSNCVLVKVTNSQTIS